MRTSLIEGFTYAIPLHTSKNHSVEKVGLRFYYHKGTRIPKDYLQKIEAEIHFIATHCPFTLEADFANLLLNMLYSETRIHNPDDFPFRKIQVQIGLQTFEIDKVRFNIVVEKTKFGWADCLFVNEIFGVYRLRIAAGLEIPPHVHHVMEEKEMTLTDSIHLDGLLIPSGTINIWPRNLPHRYENRTKKEQSILCIDEPPFDSRDEILV